LNHEGLKNYPAITLGDQITGLVNEDTAEGHFEDTNHFAGSGRTACSPMNIFAICVFFVVKRSFQAYLTSNTGQLAKCSTLFTTEPSSKACKPPCPCLPITIWSTPCSSAYRTIASAGVPTLMWYW